MLAAIVLTVGVVVDVVVLAFAAVVAMNLSIQRLASTVKI